MANERQQRVIRINGKEYKLGDLSTEAKTQLTHLRMCDSEIQRLKTQMAIVETARNAYARALEANLPKTAN